MKALTLVQLHVLYTSGGHSPLRRGGGRGLVLGGRGLVLGGQLQFCVDSHKLSLHCRVESILPELQLGPDGVVLEVRAYVLVHSWIDLL